MKFVNRLRRGRHVKRITGRAAPALLAFALLSTPMADAYAGERDKSFIYGDALSAQALDVTEVAASQEEEISISDLSPAAQQFLLTAQLAQADEDANDPIEGFNRAMFAFNEGFYDVIMRPVSSAYNVLPSNIRLMINSFLANLSAPIIFINDVLQGEAERAFTTLRRFVLNSTVGMAGLVDVASSVGLERHNEDFGQTLAVWGVDEGFYLVLPILGPSNPRDAIGRFIVDPLIDPVNRQLDDTGNENWIWGRYAISAVDQFAAIKDELDQIKKTSVDYYAAIRSLYRQKRKAEISNGEEMDLPPIPDFEFGKHGDEDHIDPAVGGNEDVLTEEEQLSLREFEEESEEKILENPFEAQFVPALGVREIADHEDAIRPSPRKPAEHDWTVKTVTPDVQDDALVAEASWEPVIISTSR